MKREAKIKLAELLPLKVCLFSLIFSCQETPILEASTVTSEENEVEAIAGPSDIYTKFPSCFGPRSILKSKTQPEKQRRKKKRERKVGFEADDSVPAKTETKEVSTMLILRAQKMKIAAFANSVDPDEVAHEIYTVCLKVFKFST